MAFGRIGTGSLPHSGRGIVLVPAKGPGLAISGHGCPAVSGSGTVGEVGCRVGNEPVRAGHARELHASWQVPA